MAIINDIIKKINKANSIALYCHTNPDGDAISSMLSIYVALKNMGKEVEAFCDSTLNFKFKYYPYKEVVQFPNKKTYELGIALDCSDIDRLGECMKSFLSCKSTIAIDHHATHKKFADLTFVNAESAANTQNVYKILKEMKTIDNTIARLLFTGIVTDSGCFSFSNTTKETFEIACELLNYNFDMEETVYTSFKLKNVDLFNLQNRVLSKARFESNNKIAFIIFEQADFDATNTTSNDTEGIISNLMNIDSVQVAYALSEVGQNHYKLSIRTKAPIDAAEIALIFGGGGHTRAAGCRVNGDKFDLIEKLTKIANDRM